MNLKFKETFSGKVVNKKLTFNTGMDEFPRYVLEYLVQPLFVVDNSNSCQLMRSGVVTPIDGIKTRQESNYPHNCNSKNPHYWERKSHWIRD